MSAKCTVPGLGVILSIKIKAIIMPEIEKGNRYLSGK